MSWVAAGVTAASLAGSVIGSSSASSSAKAGLNYQKGQSEKSILGQLYSQNMNDSLMSPGYSAYRASTPLLTYMLTGVNTAGEFTDSDMQELNSLRDQKQELLRKQSAFMGSATGSRSNQRKYRAWLSNINAKLSRLSDLENRYSANNAMQQVSEDGVLRDPGYNWQKQHGEESVNRALAARGMYNSRAGVNALSDFNSQLNADTYQRQVNNLYNLSNLGRGAATTGASLNQNTATNVGNTLAQTGQSVAQGMANIGQQQGSMWANALSAPAAMYQNYQYSNALSGSPVSSLNNSGTLNSGWDAAKANMSVAGK